MTGVRDTTTHSNYEDVSTNHVHFNWTIDWKAHRFVGEAIHTLVVQTPDVKEVIFDTNKLVIDQVFVGGKHVEHTLGPEHPVVGSPLTVPLPSGLAKGDSVEVSIAYSTTEESTAIGWLEKEQTAGKKFEYLYTQCQAIYARTVAPLQDTPSVKITYSANVKSILPVLCSAIRVSPPSEEVHGGKRVGIDEVEYVYKQPVPIPSYLLAIASGDLVYRAFPSYSAAPSATPSPPLSGQKKKWRTGLWTEPSVLDQAYWEFEADTARWVHEAEQLITPYEFGVYDLLVLPYSFPFGGMENACLTFVTPTLLAGDRTLTDVVAHEVSHSWFGNNVTTADSSHFWLNEGWTTYLERVLVGKVHNDPAARDFSYIIGRKALEEALKQYEDEPRYQRLVVPYTWGEDPDDAYSSVPYEKGSNFLLYLERLLGGLDVFLPYAREYVKTYRGKAIRTDDWKKHLYSYWSDPKNGGGEKKIKILDSVDWAAWFDGEGLTLPVEPQYDTSLAESAYKLAQRWIDSAKDKDPSASFGKGDLDGFSSSQTVVFLERLASLDGSSILPATHLRLLSSLYPVSRSSNTEIRHRYYALVLPSAIGKEVLEGAAEWVAAVQIPYSYDEKKDEVVEKEKVKKNENIKGRMKFCRPTFRAMSAVDSAYALKVWSASRVYFHPIARRMIDKDLGFVGEAK